MTESTQPAPTTATTRRRTTKKAAAPGGAHRGEANRRVLQRQIMPIDRDFDVFALYVDAEDASLDADKYEIGGTRSAKDLNNAAIRQATSTGKGIHPDQIESRTALRVRSGERLSFGTYFNAFPATYWRRWTVVSRRSGSPSTCPAAGHRDRLPLDSPTATRSGPTRQSTGAEAKDTFVFDLPLQAVHRRRLVLVRRRGR